MLMMRRMMFHELSHVHRASLPVCVCDYMSEVLWSDADCALERSQICRYRRAPRHQLPAPRTPSRASLMAFCCTGRSGQPVAEVEASASFSELTMHSLSVAGIQPVNLTTREANRDQVMEQRRSAYHQITEMPTPSREKTRVALAAQPANHRMSRVGTMARGILVKNMEHSSKEGKDMTPIVAHHGAAAGLIARLRTLGLASVEMEGDGNCQFRSVADQLFGSQQHHSFVRATAVAHMRKSSDFFGMYFETPGEYQAYLRDMGRNRTWGDELTLRACVEAFGCVTHVVTSEAQNWYLVYRPDSPPEPASVAQLCEKNKLPTPKPGKDIFINYISPIHYNAVAALVTSP